MTQVLLLPIGGTLARVPDEETPLGLRGSAFNFHAISVWADPENHTRWAREIYDATQPWTSERTYLNFIGDEGEERVRTAYDPEKFGRLVALVLECDPDNLFRLNHNLKPSSKDGAAS